MCARVSVLGYMLRSNFCFRPWESKHLKHFFLFLFFSGLHFQIKVQMLFDVHNPIGQWWPYACCEFVWYGSSCAHPQCICSICLSRIHSYNVCFELITPQPCPCHTGWHIHEQCQREFDFSISWKRNLLFTWPSHLQERTVHEGE